MPAQTRRREIDERAHLGHGEAPVRRQQVDRQRGGLVVAQDNLEQKIAEQQRRILVLQSQLMNSSHKEESKNTSAEPTLVDRDRPGKAHPLADFSPVVPDGLVGSSPRIKDLLHLVRKVAASQSAVLLRGESGTGKEILARALHENSPRP